MPIIAIAANKKLHDYEEAIRRAGGRTETVPLIARLDTEEDVEYWLNGGILPAVWRDCVAAIG